MEINTNKGKRMANEDHRKTAIALVLTAFATNESWTVEKATELSLNALLQMDVSIDEIKEAQEIMMGKLGQ